MKFALVNNERYEPIPKTRGICPVCGGVVIAKCGKLKAHHWAHETKQGCRNDRWETEGEWHRNWKNKFPIECQEKIILANEVKNIADVQTNKGLVIEFQHSHMDSEEQRARESAYKNMIWVVDGTRLKYDFPRFQKNIKHNSVLFLEIRKNIKLFCVYFCDEVFPKNWTNCTVPVVFDFLGLEDEEKTDVFQRYLYFLLPRTKVKESDTSAFLLYLPRKNFLPLINSEWESFYAELISSIIKIQKAKRENAPQPVVYYGYRRRPRRNIF